MKNVKTGLKASVFMLTGILCLCLIAPQKATAQQENNSPRFGVYGYPLNVSTPTPKVEKRLSTLASGFKKACTAGRTIEAFGYSDYHRFGGVSKRVSDRKNDILAWDRLRKAIRYLVDEKSVPEYCFDENDPIYADSDVRGVDFRIISKPNLQNTTGKMDEANTAIKRIDQELAQLRAKNEKQDERIRENQKRSNKAIETANKAAELAIESSEQTTRNETDIHRLEKEGFDVSGFLGVGANIFAGEAGISGMAGIKLAQIGFSSWYSYAPYIGVHRLKPGVTQTIRRESYGGAISWYGFSAGSDDQIEFGPMIKFDHGENIIKKREAYVAGYEAVSGGIALEFWIYRNFHLRANIAYAPVMNTFTNTDRLYTGNGKRFSGGFTVGINL